MAALSIEQAATSTTASTGNTLEDQYNNFASAHGAKFLSVLCSLFVIVVNALLLNIIRKFALFEKRHTLTQMNVSVAYKLTVARFINSSLVLVVANWNAENWFQAGNLVYDASILILSLAFTYPTTYLLNIGGWVKSYKKCRAMGNEKTT